MKTSSTESIEKVSILNRIITSIKKFWNKNGATLISFLGLITVFIVFTIITKGALLRKVVIKNIINQSIITAIIATGAVFLFSVGMIDLSLGSTCAVGAIIAVRIANNFNNNLFILFAVCVVISVLILSINGSIIGLTKLPSFIVTLVMMNILSSLAKLLLPEGQDSVSIPYSVVSALNNTWFLVGALVLVLVSAVFIFNYTPLGRKNKVLGGNRVNANLSGINFFKTTFLSYLFCGIALGISTFILVTRSANASATTGTKIGFDVIVCLVLGAMPISGGVSSKISAGVIGSFTIVILNNGLTLAGVPIAFVQAIRAVIFLTIVTLLLYKTRTKFLV